MFRLLGISFVSKLNVYIIDSRKRLPRYAVGYTFVLCYLCEGKLI